MDKSVRRPEPDQAPLAPEPPIELDPKALLAEVRARWSLLTDSDITAMLAHRQTIGHGSFSALAARLRERYSLSEQEALREVELMIDAVRSRGDD